MVVDIMTGPRTIAEESYIIPVILEPSEQANASMAG